MHSNRKEDDSGIIMMLSNNSFEAENYPYYRNENNEMIERNEEEDKGYCSRKGANYLNNDIGFWMAFAGNYWNII